MVETKKLRCGGSCRVLLSSTNFRFLEVSLEFSKLIDVSSYQSAFSMGNTPKVRTSKFYSLHVVVKRRGSLHETVHYQQSLALAWSQPTNKVLSGRQQGGGYRNNNVGTRVEALLQKFLMANFDAKTCGGRKEPGSRSSVPTNLSLKLRERTKGLPRRQSSMSSAIQPLLF